MNYLTETYLPCWSPNVCRLNIWWHFGSLSEIFRFNWTSKAAAKSTNSSWYCGPTIVIFNSRDVSTTLHRVVIYARRAFCKIGHWIDSVTPSTIHLSQILSQLSQRQCDQIGRFWKFLATNLPIKVAHKDGCFLG